MTEADLIETRPADLALEISANPHWLCFVRQFVNLLARNLDLTSEEALQLEMSVDEACANSIQGALDAGTEPTGAVRIEVAIRDGTLHVIVADSGEDFSEQFHRARPMSTFTDRSRRRGYGLQIIKTFMDDVHYERDPQNGNRLHLIKRLTRNKTVKPKTIHP